MAPLTPSPPTRSISTPLRMRYNIWWCLDKLNQHAFSAQRATFITLGVNKCHVVPACPLSDAPRSKAHSLTCEPLHALGQRVHPQPDMVQSRDVHSARHGEKNDHMYVRIVSHVKYY